MNKKYINEILLINNNEKIEGETFYFKLKFLKYNFTYLIKRTEEFFDNNRNKKLKISNDPCDYIEKKLEMNNFINTYIDIMKFIKNSYKNNNSFLEFDNWSYNHFYFSSKYYYLFRLYELNDLKMNNYELKNKKFTNIEYNKSFLLKKYKKKINKLLIFGNYNVINYIQLLKSFNLLDKTKINNNILNELLKNIDYNNNLFNNINIRNVYFILKFLVKQKMICFNKVKNKLSDKIYTKYSLINNYYLKKLFKYFNVDFINMFKLKS
jgi:hypothetical protein